MNDTNLSFDNLAHVSHMQRLLQEESEHFEISGPFEGSLCLGRVSHSRGMQGMSSVVKRGRLGLQHSVVGGSCPSASLGVSEEQEHAHLLLEIKR